MILLFLVLLLLLCALLQHHAGRRSLERLETDHLPSISTAEPGQDFEILLTFQNRSRFFLPFLRFREYIPEGLEPRLDREHIYLGAFGRRYASGTLWLAPRRRLQRAIPVTAGRRGCYTLSDLQVTGGDFLGLREEVGHFNKLREIVVYPAPAACPELTQVFGGFLGELSVRRFLQEDPVLTLGFREYTGREPMKTISWPQSARRGELMVKVFDYTLEPTVSVLLNVQCDGPRQEELIEACYRLTRGVCDQLEARGVKYDFRMNAITAGEFTPPDQFTLGLGSAHYYGIMEQLGRGICRHRIPCSAALEQAMESIPSGRGMVFITPGDDPQPAQLARRLAGRYARALLVLTPGEVGLC